MQFASHDLDTQVVFDRYIGSGSELHVLQKLLQEAAPRWSRKLRISVSQRDQRPIDLDDPDSLHDVLLRAIGERGPTYREVARREGLPADPPISGSAEIRGANPELTVVVGVNHAPVSRLGERIHLGNDVVMQVRRPRVERVPGAEWLE